MHCKTIPALRRFALALGFGCMASGASAGLVTGVWDPQFGSYLPGLSWAVRGVFDVPTTCSNQADGDYATVGACAGVSVSNLWLRLYDTGSADPNDFFTITPNSSFIDFQAAPSIGYGVTKVRVTSGQIVGFEAGRQDLLPLILTPVYGWYYFGPVAARQNLFGLILELDGPDLECAYCDPVSGATTNYDNPSVYADKANLTQFLVTYTSDDTSVAKFTDAGGAPLGAVLDGAGNYLGQSTWANLVPEPGALTLVATALAALALTRRRRA